MIRGGGFVRDDGVWKQQEGVTMKVLGILGSARRRGNSAKLLDAVLKGAARAGAENGGTVYVQGLTFSGCVGCDGCVSTGRCALTDDMDGIYRRIRESRLLVLASPIYYDGVSGQLKLLFDRLRPFSKDGGRLDGKRAGAILACWADREREDYLASLRALANYFSWFGDFEHVETVGFHGLYGANDVDGKPDYLQQAEALGRRLAEAL